MAAIKTAMESNVVDRNASDVSGVEMAAIAERIGVSAEDVSQALQNPETVREVMRERHLSEDLAILLLIANAQARRRKDAIVTLSS